MQPSDVLESNFHWKSTNGEFFLGEGWFATVSILFAGFIQYPPAV